MSNGIAKRNGSEGTETIVLRLADLGESEISFSNTRSVILTDGEIQKYALYVGDVLFIRVNGSKENVGKSFYFDNESLSIAYCDHLIRCTPTGVLHGKLLSMFMRCGYVRQLIGERMVSAAGQNTISQPSLATILLPVPPLKEQDRIILRLDNADSYISQISNSKQELIEITLRAKTKILDLAIRGQLVPQDPNDEPASVLLERIRAEKEELIKQGKIKRDKKESVIFRGDDNSYYEKIGSMVVNIDSEIPFELPDNWKFVRLKEVWELISGRDLAPSEYNASGEGIPYITGASNFTDGKVDLVRWTTSPQVITNTGDLLLTCKGTIGEMAFNNFGSAHIARQIMAIRNIFALNSEYLAICMSFYISTIKSVAKGLIPGISREDVLNLILPIPSLNYQAKVVEQVGKMVSILSVAEQSLS